jgi:putative ATP-dependent endonuclease of the OLD family
MPTSDAQERMGSVRLVKARVEGYRCVQDETVGFGPLTALVGSGGVGKSALLRAIDWCVNERPCEEEDLYRDSDGNAAQRIVVTLHFRDIGDFEKQTLGSYAVGDQTTIARIWERNGSPVLSGSAYFYPPFDAVRAEKGAKKTAAYKALFEEEGEEKGYPTPRATNVTDVDAHMAQFERAHADDLCELRPPEATHLFGFTSGPRLRDCFDYVFVSADTDAPDAFGDGRDSPLTQLLRNIGGVDEETQAKIDKIQVDAQEEASALYGDARKDALNHLEEGITGRLQDYVPDASVHVTEEFVPPPPPKARPRVQIVHAGSYPTDVERQGHGLQRTLVIAVLQVLAESRFSGGSGEEVATPKKSLMLAIEEPELYQHPLQARAVATALLQLSAGEEENANPQIAYSTHSEHFVRPALFEDLRVVRRDTSVGTKVVAADASLVEEALEKVGLADQEVQVRNTLSVSLSQAVFAKRVVLCEGRTDAVLLEAVASMDRPFEQDGIAVAECHGKSIIPVALAILKGLEIPCFVLFDADRQVKEKLEQSEKGTKADRDAQISGIATKNRQLLELCDESPEDWPERDVRTRCSNFTGNVESDIPEVWPELAAARDSIAAELSLKPKSGEVYRRAPEAAGAIPPFFTQLLAAVRTVE